MRYGIKVESQVGTTWVNYITNWLTHQLLLSIWFLQYIFLTLAASDVVDFYTLAHIYLFIFTFLDLMLYSVPRYSQLIDGRFVDLPPAEHFSLSDILRIWLTFGKHTIMMSLNLLILIFNKIKFCRSVNKNMKRAMWTFLVLYYPLKECFINQPLLIR